MRAKRADVLARASLDADDRTRLIQVLRIYCGGLDPVQLGDLHSSLARGHYPWLRAAFATAITDNVFDQHEWNAIVGRADDRSEFDAAAAMRTDQQRIWSTILPDDPFPNT